MHIRKMKDLQTFATRFGRLRKGIRFWFGKPVGHVQRRCWGERTQAEEILAQHLEMRLN